jgi:hypothetical protein
MFRLIRLSLLLVVAFAAGVVYERGQARERCETSGGDYDRGLCTPFGGQP